MLFRPSSLSAERASLAHNKTLVGPGPLFRLEDGKRAPHHAGVRAGNGELLKWLAEGGGGGGGRKALRCPVRCSPRIQPWLRLRERQTAPGESCSEPGLLAAWLSFCSCRRDRALPAPCPRPACRIRPSSPSHRGTAATAPFHPAIPSPPIPDAAHSLISPIRYPKSIKIYF